MVKKNVLFIHSAGPQDPGQGSSGLFSYLQKELEKDIHLFRPSMPAPENPQYKLWKEQIGKTLQELRGEILLVGHSLGRSVLLKYLSENPARLRCQVYLSSLLPFGGSTWSGS